MEEFPLLGDLLIVFAVSAGVLYLFQQLRLPATIGLLVAGLLVGPFGLQLVSDVERVRVLAEIGVVVLLFTVGLEFALSRLWELRHVVFAVGLPQIVLSGAVTAAATVWYLEGFGPAVFAGMLVAMSSTAVVLKVLSDRGELSAPHGRIAVAVLLLQDLLVAVFMLLVPVLAGQADEGPSLWLRLLQGLFVVTLILAAARYVVPPVLYQIVRTRNRELFLIGIVVLCLGTAGLTAWSGLSLALGAFLAGVALADSEYAQQTLAEVLPFRDTLSSLFFVSVGMLLDVRFVTAQGPLILLTVAAILLLKFSVTAGPVWISGYPLRVAVLVGLALPQVGEFSFLLAEQGRKFGLLEADDFQIFLAAAVITMALTPLLIAAGPWLADRLPGGLEIRRPRRSQRPGRSASDADEEPIILKDHVMIAGYGVNGRNVARVLRDVDVPYVVIEMNPATVRELRRKGEPIYFGDCSRRAVLEHFGLRRARLLVIAISDPASTRRAVQAARQLSPHVHIIVRTRYVAEVEELRSLGADEIIPEEFETSVEIFARVLARYQLPRNLILDLIDRIRRDHYEVLRDLSLPATKVELPYEILSVVEVDSCLIREDSPAVGRSLGELDLRKQTGATLIAVRRDDELLRNPGPELRFQAGDTVLLVGDRPQIDRALLLLDPQLAAPSETPD